LLSKIWEDKIFKGRWWMPWDIEAMKGVA